MTTPTYVDETAAAYREDPAYHDAPPCHCRIVRPATADGPEEWEQCEACRLAEEDAEVSEAIEVERRKL